MRDVRPSRAAASQHGALTDADLTDADLTAYLARIGYGGPTDPTAEVLGDLVAGRRRRGGYCYEHNGLMGYVLDRLGYDVERYAGRVVWMSEPGGPLPARTHQVLGVAARIGQLLDA